MAKNYNSELSQELQDGGKIQVSLERIPSEFADKIVPVMETNPKLLRNFNYTHSNTATNATSATIYAVPTGNIDFFIQALQLSVIKDATSTSVKSAITATIDGVAQDLLSIPEITLTAGAQSVSLSLPRPLKIDKGTNIVVTNSTNVANILATGVIFGFHVYNAGA